MPVEQPRNYLIDVSTLFTKYCSEHAVSWTTDFLGGFNRLTDICCHIAISLLKDNDIDVAKNMVREVTNRQPIDVNYLDMVEKVILSYAIVLRDYFVGVATVGCDRRLLNHIEIHEANIVAPINPYTVNMQERRDVSTVLTATFHWHR